MTRAASLVREAEAACKAGNNGLASEKAKAAIEVVKKSATLAAPGAPGATPGALFFS